jgi:hypothetical protein
MGHECNCHGCKPACIGMKLVALGAIVISNELFFRVKWWLLIGGILILKGLMIVIMKDCMCHKSEECCEIKKEKKHEKK